MKHLIEVIGSKRYLPCFERLVLIVRRLGIGSSNFTPDGIWINATNGADAGRFGFTELSCGSTVVDDRRPELNQYKRSGEARRLAGLPT